MTTLRVLPAVGTILLLIPLLLLTPTAVVRVAAQVQIVTTMQPLINYTPGVRPGDWATYDTSALPAELREIKEIRVYVVHVNGTTIWFNEAIVFRNGTAVSGQGWVDVRTGARATGGIGLGILYFISANLSRGDRVFDVPNAPPINYTTKITCAGLERDANVLRLYIQDGVADFYWDRATGVLCEASMSLRINGSVVGILLRLRETSLWRPLTTPTPTTPLLTTSVTIATLVTQIPTPTVTATILPSTTGFQESPGAAGFRISQTDPLQTMLPIIVVLSITIVALAALWIVIQGRGKEMMIPRSPSPSTTSQTQGQQTGRSTEIYYCPNCGKPIPLDAKYCPYCGFDLASIRGSI